jgi:hypothetical protein
MEKKKISKKSTKSGKDDKKEKVKKNKKASSPQSLPTHEEITAKAMEIYTNRIERGENGNAETDWLEAERILTNKG